MYFAAQSFINSLPAWYVYGFTFVFGAMVGSFLNVCIYRIPLEGMSVVYPPNSKCPECGGAIRWFDNIPILSYLFLGGRCRHCKTGISMQYPIVELMTAVMALALVKKFGVHWGTLVLFAWVCGLIVITFIDLAYWIIPDEISLPGIVVGIAAAYFLGPPHLPHWHDAVWGAVLGGGSLAAISIFYEVVMKRTGMGFGDVKLLAMLGAFLGWKPLFLVVLLASLQGLAAALLMYMLGWREGAPDDEFFEEHEEVDEATTVLEASEASEEDVVLPSKRAQDTVSEDEAPEVEEAETAEVEEVETAEVEEAKAEEEPAIAAPKDEDEDTAQPLEDEEEEEEEPDFRHIAIPFGPFLALAALEALFWQKEIMEWLFRGAY